jgi:hypothetical protein
MSSPLLGDRQDIVAILTQSDRDAVPNGRAGVDFKLNTLFWRSPKTCPRAADMVGTVNEKMLAKVSVADPDT